MYYYNVDVTFPCMRGQEMKLVMVLAGGVHSASHGSLLEMAVSSASHI